MKKKVVLPNLSNFSQLIEKKEYNEVFEIQHNIDKLMQWRDNELSKFIELFPNIDKTIIFKNKKLKDLFYYLVSRKSTISTQSIEGITIIKNELEDLGNQTNVDFNNNQYNGIDYKIKVKESIKMQYYYSNWKLTKELTPDLIKELHRDFFYNSKSKHPGDFKTVENWINSGNKDLGDIYFVDPRDVHKELNQLCEWYKETKELNNKFPIFLLSSIFHAHFVSIHPFIDGNGRIARFLSTKIISNKYNSLFPIEYTLKKKKRDYYNSLNKYRANDFKSFYRFFGQCYISQLIEDIDEIKELRKEALNLKETLGSIEELKGKSVDKLVSCLMKYNNLYINRFVEDMGIGNKTASKYLKILKENKIIEENKYSRNKKTKVYIKLI